MGWVLETKDSSWSGSGLQKEQGNRELGESCQPGEMRRDAERESRERAGPMTQADLEAVNV